MSGKIDRIVFTGDFLRPAGIAMRPTQHENILWLSHLLRVPLGMATGLPSETVRWDNNWINGAVLDLGAVEAIYQAFGLTPGIKGWSRLYGSKELPGSVEALFLRLFRRSLVVGFEIPPYLARFCDRNDIPFIDCALSPVRFMDDLLIEVGSSCARVTAQLREWHVPETLIELQAGVLSSNVAKMNPYPPHRNSLLVILQTRHDKVVLHDGRFVSMLDHFEALSAIASGYSHVLIKQHPLEPQEEVAAALVKALPNAALTTDNFYQLVSHDNLRGVVALSSSCVHEAKYFGKTGHYLIPGFSHDRSDADLPTAYVGDALITPDFWRDILAPSSLVAVTQKDGLRLGFKPNRFRQQLRSAWGFNQVDTDIPVSWAPRP